MLCVNLPHSIAMLTNSISSIRQTLIPAANNEQNERTNIRPFKNRMDTLSKSLIEQSVSTVPTTVSVSEEEITKVTEPSLMIDFSPTI